MVGTYNSYIVQREKNIWNVRPQFCLPLQESNLIETITFTEWFSERNWFSYLNVTRITARIDSVSPWFSLNLRPWKWLSLNWLSHTHIYTPGQLGWLRHWASFASLSVHFFLVCMLCAVAQINVYIIDRTWDKQRATFGLTMLICGVPFRCIGYCVLVGDVRLFSDQDIILRCSV